MAEAGQNRPRHNSDAPVGVSVLHSAILRDSLRTLEELSETYERKVALNKMYLIRRLYNLRMKESDSVQAHLNEYESLSSQITLSRYFATVCEKGGTTGVLDQEERELEKE